jgi:hypothetical protein
MAQVDYGSVQVSQGQSAIRTDPGAGAVVLRNSVVSCGEWSCLGGVTVQACTRDSCGDGAICQYSANLGITCSCPPTWTGKPPHARADRHVPPLYRHVERTIPRALSIIRLRDVKNLR